MLKSFRQLGILLSIFILSLLSVPRPVEGQIPGTRPITIQVRNTENRERLKEVVSIDFARISPRMPDIRNFKVMNKETGEELLYQLEFRGMTRPQNLLVQVTLPPNGKVTIEILEGKPAAFRQKTFARYVPERKDDFAWENNLVGFRMYGKALESTNENAYGIDVWSKRTENLIIDKWYKAGDYHTDHGEGMDYYSVGFTLGGGDIAPFIGDSIYFSKNYVRYEVLDNGPLRSTFRLYYDAWQAGPARVTAVKEISLDADSYLNRISVTYDISGIDRIPAVIGIVKRRDPGDILFSETNKVMGYWEPQIKQNGKTGVGCIIAGEVRMMDIADGHLLSHVTVTNNDPVVYYAGASWSKAGKITSAEKWFSYLSSFASGLRHPVQVTFL